EQHRIPRASRPGTRARRCILQQFTRSDFKRFLVEQDGRRGFAIFGEQTCRRMEGMSVRGARAPRSPIRGGVMGTLFYAVLIAATLIGQKPTPWRVLFDGTSLESWRGYKTGTVPSGWHIADGALTKETPVADTVPKDEYGDFGLELEWK